MDIFQAVILGIVEGVTEFLPISSTGHLILTSKLMGLNQDSFVKTFEVAIQLGSILAVVVLFYQKLIQKFDLWVKLAFGFIPTGIFGLTLHKSIKGLFDPKITAYMLIIGGIVFIVLELFKKPSAENLDSLDAISYKQAFCIGLFQVLAMIPGTSRSGATIVGGLLMGLSRKNAAEFSFLLAIPTIFAATGYDLYKNLDVLQGESSMLIGIGGLCAFLTSMLIIKLFLRFISRFGYTFFGIYRIVIGVIVLLWVL